MVHGGPWVRGVKWGFNPANQFLASRGYAVIEPEFRGSTGYGSKLFKSQAHRIKQPVLMAYGEEDLRVPLPHGVKMRDALLASGNRNVEWVQYEKEGHGWNLERNNVDFWSRVERFLAQHLK